MSGASITFHVDDSERDDFVRRAERDKVSLSDYIRVRLGLRALGTHTDGDIEIDPRHEVTLQQQLADHELRLRALEAR